MNIKLSPQYNNLTLTLSVEGDTLTINGEDFDFSAVPEGATLPSSAVDSDFIVGNIERIDGDINLTVLFPIPSDASEAARFPDPINQSSGLVELPI